MTVRPAIPSLRPRVAVPGYARMHLAALSCHRGKFLRVCAVEEDGRFRGRYRVFITQAAAEMINDLPVDRWSELTATSSSAEEAFSAALRVGIAEIDGISES